MHQALAVVLEFRLLGIGSHLVGNAVIRVCVVDVVTAFDGLSFRDVTSPLATA